MSVTNTMGAINLKNNLCCFVASRTGPEIAFYKVLITTNKLSKYFRAYSILMYQQKKLQHSFDQLEHLYIRKEK